MKNASDWPKNYLPSPTGIRKTAGRIMKYSPETDPPGPPQETLRAFLSFPYASLSTETYFLSLAKALLKQSHRLEPQTRVYQKYTSIKKLPQTKQEF